MTTAKKAIKPGPKPSPRIPDEDIIAFGTATADPQTLERFRINDRLFYRQEFTAGEEASFLRDTEQGREDLRSAGGLWLTENEVILLADPLNKRIADGGSRVEGQWLSNSLTASDYRGLLRILSPNIARLYDALQGVSAGGK
jgi:hypothetical protein